MANLSDLSKYAKEKGYDRLAWILPCNYQPESYFIGLENPNGDVVSLLYNPHKDELTGGKVNRNEGFGKILIEMVKKGEAYPAVSDHSPEKWEKIIEGFREIFGEHGEHLEEL